MKQRIPTKQVVSGKLNGNPNLIYDVIDNNDVVMAPYMDRLDPTDFALYKRKAYKNILANDDYIGWTFNDAARIRYGQCEGDGRINYVQATNEDGDEGQILRYLESQSGTVNCLSQSAIGDNICICECQSNRLVLSMGPRGNIMELPGSVTQSDLGVQDSATVGGVEQGRFWIETSLGSGVAEDLTSYSSGSYRYIYAMCAGSASTDGIGGQIRKIVGYDSGTKEWILDAPRILGTDTTDRANVTFSVFDNRGEVINYVDCNGINTLHPDGASVNLTYACNTAQSGDACIKGFEYFDGRLRYINTEGRIAYSGTGYDIYFFTADQYTIVPAQAIAIAAFQNNLIYMGYDFIGAVYKKEFYGGTGYSSFNMSNNIGLWSKNSYFDDASAFYIVTNEKKLQAISVVANGGVPTIQFQDVIDVFDGELGRLQKGDDVYINRVGDELRIHIITKAIAQDGISVDKSTKVLIYDTKVKLYHTHTICEEEVTRYKNDIYLGSGAYRRCGYEDGGVPNTEGQTTGTTFYDQTISAFVGSNKNNGLTFDVFNPKIINMVKTDIGPSIITAGNTSLKYVTHRMGRRSQYILDDWTTVPWVENMNTIAAGDNVIVDACMLADMLDCQNITNNCEDGFTNVAKPTVCNCSAQYYEPREYCACHEDSKYMLSLTYPIVSKFKTKKFDLAKLERKASEGDRLYFQGFIAELEIGQAVDNYDLDNVIEQQECCTRVTYVAPVTNLSAVMASGTCGDITLSRTASATAGVTYTIREGETTLFSGLSVLSKNIGSATGEHTYKVYAVKDGSESVMAQVEITAAYCPPSAPSNASVSGYSCGTTVDLTWTASATSGVTYNVYDGATLLGNTNVTNYSATGLTIASHTFTIKALKNGVESTGASVSQTTSACVLSVSTDSVTIRGGNPLNVNTAGTISLNGNTITEKGFLYYVSGNVGTTLGAPGVSSAISLPLTPENPFTGVFFGLSSATTYFFRAYIKDSVGTPIYGSPVQYVTP